MGNHGFAQIEFQMLWASAVLGLVQIAIASVAGWAFVGIGWMNTARDEPPPATSRLTARLDRALKNYTETFAVFAVAILLARELGRHTVISAMGSQLYFWGRVAYVPAYALGVPYVRGFIWDVATIGIIMVLVTVFSAL
jgi:uncharacterized MAPEG superfamily protein